MAISDYDADATELLETYGVFHSVQPLPKDAGLICCVQTSS